MNTPATDSQAPCSTGKSPVFQCLMIVVLHVAVIGGMLLQGCKDTKDTAATPPPDTVHDLCRYAPARDRPQHFKRGPPSSTQTSPSNMPIAQQTAVTQAPPPPLRASDITPVAPPTAPTTEIVSKDM